jgi:hypothetical protein
VIDGLYINLERSPERRAAMEQQLREARLPYPVRRFPALEGATLRDCPPGLRAPQWGCFQSHLAALEASLSSEAPLHVMEDDALLGPELAGLPGILETLEAGSGGDWDLLFLDATLIELPDMQLMYEWTELAREKGTVHVRGVPRGFCLYGLHSYVVNGRRKGRVHAFLRQYSRAGRAIDGVTAHGIQSGALKASVTAPFLTSGSDLGLTNRTLGERDDSFLAWFLFRRLCFGRLDGPALAALERDLERLLPAIDRAERLLGALMAYRVARWPRQRFPPGIEA